MAVSLVGREPIRSTWQQLSRCTARRKSIYNERMDSHESHRCLEGPAQVLLSGTDIGMAESDWQIELSGIRLHPNCSSLAVATLVLRTRHECATCHFRSPLLELLRCWWFSRIGPHPSPPGMHPRIARCSARQHSCFPGRSSETAPIVRAATER